MNSSDHHHYYSSFDNIDLNLNVVVDQLPLICSKTVIADHEAPPPQISHGAGGGFYFEESNNFSNHEEAKTYVCDGGSRQNQAVMKSENHDKGLIKLSPPKREDHKNEIQREKLCTSVKWVSSKMKITKKITNPDADLPETSIQKFEDEKGLSSSPSQTINNYNNSNNSSINCNNTIRVCRDCYTTKTPLWRSGPRGPKSLCNACGIRQRKARRAMAAAAAAETTIGGPFRRGAAYAPTTKTKVQHKEIKKTNNYNKNSHLPLKKRCKFREQGRGQKRFGFEDLTIILSKNSTYQQVFHQDEKEAATLLMALSYGLVHG